MNITWPASQKKRDIVSGPQATDIDEIVRQLYADMNKQASNIGDYLVDLANDVTGTLSPLRLGASSSPSPLKFYREDGSFATTPTGGSNGFIPTPGVRTAAWNYVTDSGVSRDVGLASTSGGASAVQKDSAGWWIRRTTAAASPGASINYTSTGSAVFWADLDPYLEFRFRTGASVAAVRYWLGIFSTAPTNADTITGRVLGMRFSTVAGDTGFTTIVRDNTTTTVGSPVSTVAASTIYNVKITVSSTGTAVKFTVNGVDSASLVVPAAILGTDLWWGLYMFTTDTVAKIVDTQSLYYEHN